MGIISRIKGLFLKRTTEDPVKGETMAFVESGDLPSTVRPLTTDDRHTAELRNAFSGQKWDKAVDTADGNYIWRKADEFIKQWLPSKEYELIESAIFDDCIGYRCIRKGFPYTVFMYAYGEKKTTLLDGEYCSKLKFLPFAQGSTILVVYLKVDRKETAAGTEYKVGRYNDLAEPEPWMLSDIGGKPCLLYYPRKEMLDQTWQFMYAFNREDTDIYDCLITDDNPSIEGDPAVAGIFMNSAFYVTLRRLHREYGDMKLGYVRCNDVVYCAVPYVEGLGFFMWTSYYATNRISDVCCHPFSSGKLKVEEFVKTEYREPDDLFAYIPKLVKAEPLPPVPTERFAAKLLFDNGDCRKFVLPISAEDESAEAISYMQHVFSNGIWASASVVEKHKSRYAGYPDCGAALTFKNGFYIAGTRCYLESTPYSEPELVDELVYTDEYYRIRKIWKWSAKAIYEDSETGILKVLISGQGFNWHGKSTYATVDGQRLSQLTFDHIDNFCEGLACVGIGGKGFGFIDKDMNVVVPMKYDSAEDFRDGRARVRLGDKWICVDKTGLEIKIGKNKEERRYQEIGDYSEGMCRVSTLKLRFMDLAYHSDYSEIAGIWGFVNEAGEEVISPQYIYACDFENGMAFVAKGKWTIDPKWDNEHNQGKYWTEEELWGAIDKEGNEVIPCTFDEIKRFNYRNDIFRAHIGGWKTGHWGVIDNRGNWLVEPVFPGIDSESADNLISFYAKDPEVTFDENLMGVYDLKDKKTVFAPQFLAVEFLEDGDLKVEVFDQELERTIEKIIDRNGNEHFKSVYSSIYTWKDPYEVVIQENGKSRHGLIDRDGNVLLPCVYETPWGGIHHEQKKICFIENDKQGVVDYEGNIIIPATYHEIYMRSSSFYSVKVGSADHYKVGLITSEGKLVMPAKYESIIWCSDNIHFLTQSREGCEMYVVEERQHS